MSDKDKTAKPEGFIRLPATEPQTPGDPASADTEGQYYGHPATEPTDPGDMGKTGWIKTPATEPSDGDDSAGGADKGFKGV